MSTSNFFVNSGSKVMNWLKRMRWPVEETGRNSVIPSTIPSSAALIRSLISLEPCSFGSWDLLPHHAERVEGNPVIRIVRVVIVARRVVVTDVDVRHDEPHKGSGGKRRAQEIGRAS